MKFEFALPILASPKTMDVIRPKILAAISVLGNGVAAYLFAKNSYDHKEDIHEKAVKAAETKAKEDRDEFIKEVAKDYAVPVAVYAASSAVTVSLGVTASNDIASLMAANTFISKSYGEYRQKNIEMNGADADTKIRAAMVSNKFKRKIADDGVNVFNDTDEHGYDVYNMPEKILVWSEWHDDYFETTSLAVEHALLYCNRMFALQGFLYLNQMFSYLGWPQLEKFNEYGWDMSDGYMWLDFNKTFVDIDEGIRVYFIDPHFMPEEELGETW